MRKEITASAPLGSDAMPFWSMPAEQVLAQLGCTDKGLTGAEAGERLARFGPNRIADETHLGPARLLVRQFESPLVLILVFGALVALVLREWIDATIILVIVAGSGMLGFYQEYRASRAVAALRMSLGLVAEAMRDGRKASVPVEALVPGDIIMLSAGKLVPADGLVLEARDFLVTQASLTGESFPVSKSPGRVAAGASLVERSNAVFMGSSVRSGTARVLIVTTGRLTEYGAIAADLRTRAPETEFARGVRHFGTMLMRVMTIIVLFVLVMNQLLQRPAIDSLLFAVALAVGLSPELLPAVTSIMLANGARRLAQRGVIVRRLEAIENLGSMDVLCTDKTGTLTRAEIVLDDAVDAAGRPSAEVRQMAFLNAALQTGIDNPLDAAILRMGRETGLSTQAARKVDEIPYDFARRSLAIIIADPAEPAARTLISKGAFDNLLAACDFAKVDGATRPLDAAMRARLEAFYRERGEAGFRVLAVGSRQLPMQPRYTRQDEQHLTFEGFLLFLDPAKPDAAQTVADLDRMGIAVKIISGDNRYVTAHLGAAVGLDPKAMLTGRQLAGMRDEALWHAATRTDLFVEIDPQQKERIVRALQHAGHAVGYLGDGINDAPALHAADIGISVNEAVDVARDSADVVLLQRELDVLRQGIESGRKTFANTLKYISITISANFGNMVSMALATPFLPFLPLLPKQILLNNFLSDLPLMTIATDNVDPVEIAWPHHWDIGQLQRFMVVFGLVSSSFDILTFVLLIGVLHVPEAQFQTAWLVESLLTELLVALVLRSRLSVLASRPSGLLLSSTGLVVGLTLVLPYFAGANWLFGLEPLPAGTMLVLLAIAAGYIGATEIAKRWFFRPRRRRTRHRSARARG